MSTEPAPPRCILVTGGLGFIGGYVVDECLRRFGEARVVILDAFGAAASVSDRVSTMESPRVRVECADLCDEAAVRRVLALHDPDVVLHLAAESHVDRSFANSLTFTRSNALGTHVLLEACRRSWGENARGRRFVHMSTDEVYGSGETVGPDGHSPATSILLPTNPYAASKAAAEMQCMAYVRSFGMDLVVIRCNNVYGPRQHCEKVVPRFILQALAGAPLTLHGDGSQKRSLLYVADAAAAVVDVAMKARTGEIINVGAPEEMTIRDLAGRVRKAVAAAARKYELEGVPVSGGGSEDAFSLQRDRRFNDFCYPVNIARVRELGWQPRTELEDGLEKTALWYATRAGAYFSADDLHAAVHSSGHFSGEGDMEPGGTRSGATGARPRSEGSEADEGSEPPTQPSKRPRPAAPLPSLASLVAGPFSRPLSPAALRVLVFGATGWIGGKIMRSGAAGCCFIGARARLEDPHAVWAELAAVRPDRVVLAAGLTGRPNIDWCETHVTETVRVNLEGAVNLARMCARLGIHLTNFATGCIYTSGLFDPPRTEDDPPNFFGSLYSRTKIIAEAVMRGCRPIADRCLILRLRMPIGADLDHPRNLVTKLRAYGQITDLPNSVSVLPEVLPIALHMIARGETGVYNLTNPGFVTPSDVRRMDDARLGIKEPRWDAVAQVGGLRAERSNCILDATKLSRYAGAHGLTLRPAPEAVLEVMTKRG